MSRTLLAKLPLVRSVWRWLNRRWKMRRFRTDFLQFQRLARNIRARVEVHWEDRFPCLDDNTDTMRFDRHYVYHTAWAARVLRKTSPRRHVDFSSFIQFAAQVSAFIPLEYYDFRPPGLHLDGLKTGAADLTRLPFADDSLPSVSCMHVVEHIGLGRYGDPLDPDGDAKAMAELSRVLAPRGNLLLACPLGRPRIRFNADRIYKYLDICSYFENLSLKEFALIPDDPSQGGLLYDPPQSLVTAQRYACGCFWFVKPGLEVVDPTSAISDRSRGRHDSGSSP